MTTSVKIAYGGASSITITNLNSLASSATAGWISGAIDNTTNLYDDYIVQFQLAAVNTAPSSNQAFYVFCSGLVDSAGAVYASTGASGGAPSGSEATMTYPNITTGAQNLPLLGVIPYPTQNVAIFSTPMSVKACFNGVIPPKFCLGLINFSGMTIAASANVVTVNGVYYTNG